jgi:hypothetical protein
LVKDAPSRDKTGLHHWHESRWTFMELEGIAMNETFNFTEVISVSKVRGCYLLWKGGKVIYVGQSVNVLSRIGVHLSNPQKDFDGYSYSHVRGNLNDAEAELIAKYKPSCNYDMPRNTLYASVPQLKKMFDVGGWKLRRLRGKLTHIWKDYYEVFEFYKILTESEAK